MYIDYDIVRGVATPLAPAITRERQRQRRYEQARN